MGGLLSYFRNLFGSREMRILILGLDGAGKTTLLYRLQVKSIFSISDIEGCFVQIKKRRER